MVAMYYNGTIHYLVGFYSFSYFEMKVLSISLPIIKAFIHLVSAVTEEKA